jgi:uncharacterized repeat protein (TIGR01451 family)
MCRRSLSETLAQIPRDPLLAAFALLWAISGALPAASASAQVCGGLLTDAPPSPGEQFGCSVFIQGDTLAVGANLDRPGPAATGSVVLYTRGESGWVRQAKLAPPELRDGAQFGFAAAISGDTLAVGAPFDDSAQAGGSGAVYVFRRTGGGWDQEAKLAAAGGATGDGFGLSVAASGDVLAIGAPFSSRAGSLAGAVYVFRRTAGGWSEEAALTAGDAAPFTDFGYSVAVDGGTLIAGEPFGRGFNACPGAGAAYVFVRSGGGAWVQQAKLTGQEAGSGAELGAAVAVAGSIAVVGARRDNVAGQVYAGAVYSFEGSSGTWRQIDRAVAPDAAGGALFGVSLALSGAHLLVGARGDSGAASGAGAAYVFARDQGTGRWLSSGKRTPATASPGAAFGQSVSLSGNDIVFGGPLDNVSGASRTGAVALCQLPFASLAITLDDGLTQVLPGQTVVYTLTVSNTGNETVTGAAVTDHFPSQLLNVRWCPPQEGPGCAQPRSGDINDTLDLPASVPEVYTITAQVSPNARGAITDKACVAAPAFGVAPDSVCATDTDSVLSADLALAASAPATVAMGGVLVYDLRVTNRGPSPATGVRLTDPWPPGLAPLAPGDPRCVQDQGQGRFSCALGTLPAGRSVSLRLGFNVPACYQAPTPIVNTATVAANEPDSNSANNSATVRTTLVAPAPGTPGRPACPADLKISFSPDAEINAPTAGTAPLGLSRARQQPGMAATTAAAAPGGISVLYTVDLQNTGTANLAGAQVSGAFSPNLKQVLWCRGLGCTPANPGPLADSVSLTAGETVVYQEQLLVPPNFNNFLCHTVTARLPGGEVDPTPQDDFANQLLCLTHGAPCPPAPPGFCPGARQPDLEVAFVRDAEIDPLAGKVLYTVAVQNGGAADAVGAQVSSVFSPTIAPVLWCRGLGCTPANPGPLADVLTVLAGQTVVYQVELSVPCDFNSSPLRYTVSALAPGGGLESGSPDNSQSQLLCLTHEGQCPRLALSASSCPDAAPPSPPDLDVEFVGAPEIDTAEGQAVYTVLVQNGGGTAAVAAQVSGVFSPDQTPVAWCKEVTPGMPCPPANPGPLADTPTLQPGGVVAYEVAVNVPTGFNNNLCFTVSAKVPGELEPGPPDNTRSELMCFTDGPPCPPPPPGFCPEGEQGHPDLEVAFFGDPVIDGVAGTVLYTLSLQNASDTAAVGAQVSSLFSAFSSSAIGPVSWCQGLGCTPANPGPLGETLTVPAGGFLFFQVQLHLPLSFNDFLCYAVTATVPGDAELIPDNTQNELLCFGSPAFCSSPPAGFCFHIDPQ